MLEVQFADPTTAQRHQAFFRAQTAAEEPEPPAPPPSGDENWEMVAEWDAAHPAPKTGDGRKFSAPRLVGWSPKGDHLFTSCSAWGLTAWATAALGWDSGPRKLGEDVHPAAYGYPSRLSVSQRGGAVFVLHETRSYQNHHYSLYSSNAVLLSEGSERLWGWVRSVAMLDRRLERREGLNPWRPGADGQLAIIRDSHTLYIVDVTQLPDRPIVDDRTPFEKMLARLMGSGPSGGGPAKIPLHEAPAHLAISFKPLGERGQTIFGFHFHPSGEYVAVTTGDWDQKDERRVHVVHLSSATIVASVNAPAEAYGWSPGGRFLLCLRRPAGAADPAAVFWDGWEFGESKDQHAQRLSQSWAIKAIAGDPGLAMDGNVAVSADGQRLLVGSSASRITAVHRNQLRISPGKPLAEVPKAPFAHAAWHPTDPHCFATVGGDPSEQYPDTYKGDHDRHDGRLLRIWRLRE